MRRIKVLMIDDEEEFCRGIKMGLEETGKFDVITAIRGTEGLQLAKTRRPDVILLDIVMPDITGTEVAELLSEDRDTRKIPILFLTALLKKEEEKGFGRSLSKYHIISKPVNLEDLIQKIEAIATG